MAIKECDCENKFQDDTYGKGKRVHNEMNKEHGGFRCTVCGKEKSLAAK